jgi:hypothetical protein
VHTSFIASEDILVTYGGMIVNSPPDPKRAVLKSVLNRRELRAARRLALEGVAPSHP